MPAYKKGTAGYKRQVQRLRSTLTAKYGSLEGLKEHYRTIGAKGGENGHTGGFAADRNRAVAAGRKGGYISSRSANKASLSERRAKYERNINKVVEVFRKDGYSVFRMIKNGKPHMFMRKSQDLPITELGI